MTTVLVLTNSLDDGHVEAVFEKVRAQGHKTLRVDTDRIVRGEHHISFDYATGEILYATPDGSFDLRDADSIWFRKPFGFSQTLGFVEHIKDPIQRATVDKEMHDVVESICLLLADKFWINHPTTINRARLKPYQIAVAQRVGLPVPPTLITSDPDAARRFCREGPTVFKPIAVAGLEYEDAYYSVETTLMTPKLIDGLDLIRSQPIILQRLVDKSKELRVTCVGDEIFVACQVPNKASSQVDWRSLQETGSTYEVGYRLPDDIVDSIHKIMQELGLGFAAMDFAVDGQGNIHFFEANPNGQWLGYTDMIGLPAAASIADALVCMTNYASERR